MGFNREEAAEKRERGNCMLPTTTGVGDDKYIIAPLKKTRAPNMSRCVM